MPASSVYLAILNQVGAIIQSLGLSFTPPGGGTIIPLVEVLKEPKVQEYLETQGIPGEAGSQKLPVISVSPQEEPQPAEPASTFQFVFLIYPVDVSISAGGNRDFASNLDVWLNWREQIRAQFMGTVLPGVAQVYDTDTDSDPAIDRETLQENLDRGTLTIRFKTLETRVQAPMTSTTTTSTTT